MLNIHSAILQLEYNHYYNVQFIIHSAEVAPMASPVEGEVTQQQEEKPTPQPADAPVPGTDLVELFNTTIAQHDATFVVYYRGLW